MQIRVIDSHLKPEYLQKYGAGTVFVETGTYLGDTVRLAIDEGFTKILSIELNEELYENAVNQFKDNEGVQILFGDSIDALENIVTNDLNEPATFWLDAHASGPLSGGRSGGSPLLDELRIIEKSPIKTHTIFIDDRRLFGSAEWSGIQEQEAMDIIMKINPSYQIFYLDGEVESDIICATVMGSA